MRSTSRTINSAALRDFFVAGANAENLRGAADSAKRVLDFVGDPRSDATEGGESLSLTHDISQVFLNRAIPEQQCDTVESISIE